MDVPLKKSTNKQNYTVTRGTLLSLMSFASKMPNIGLTEPNSTQYIQNQLHDPYLQGSDQHIY